MGAWTAVRGVYDWLRGWVQAYLANADPLAAASNSGAFLVWSSQPLYPLYVWLIVGKDAWPALLTWVSTPVFFAVALVARTSSLAGRVLFVVAGVANTLLSLKAFGPGAGIQWFLIPCVVIAACFFRLREWPVAVGLCALVAISVQALGNLGAPLHVYDPAQNRSLSHLNIWSVIVLSVYLAYTAFRARRTA